MASNRRSMNKLRSDAIHAAGGKIASGTSSIISVEENMHKIEIKMERMITSLAAIEVTLAVICQKMGISTPNHQPLYPPLPGKSSEAFQSMKVNRFGK